MVGEIPMRSYVASAILAGAVVLAPAVAGYAPALSKSAFTITNDPVGPTVADTMQQRTCTGTIVPIWWSHLPHMWVQAIFFGKPDGTKWVTFNWRGKGPFPFPVTELGVSAQWNTPPESYGQAKYLTHYAVWPDGDNHLSGTTADPWGTIDLTCK
jgi:hypothetical protein